MRPGESGTLPSARSYSKSNTWDQISSGRTVRRSVRELDVELADLFDAGLRRGRRDDALLTDALDGERRLFLLRLLCRSGGRRARLVLADLSCGLFLRDSRRGHGLIAGRGGAGNGVRREDGDEDESEAVHVLFLSFRVAHSRAMTTLN